ncbi:hypothetical protein TNCV_530621 [Trichonephila clavipes]|nr:hypothetical protein TNCV_530621 [Trichonephila clavipes]
MSGLWPPLVLAAHLRCKRCTPTRIGPASPISLLLPGKGAEASVEAQCRPVGVEVRRGECQLRCRPRHLTMVQNDGVRRPKPSGSFI